MNACYIKLRFLRITENVEELYLLSDKEYSNIGNIYNLSETLSYFMMKA